MPPPPPFAGSEPSLTPQERQRIEAEEVALAQVTAAQLGQQQRAQAAASYRQQVRVALDRSLSQSLRPRPLWRRLWWVWAGLGAVLVVALLLWPRPAAVTDDAWGGILNSALMEQCRAAVSAQTYAQEPDLRYPSPQEAVGQLSASADGKSWNGWAARPDGTHLDFVCTYSPALHEVSVELLR